MNELVIALLLGLIGIGFSAHIVSCAAVIWRYRGHRRSQHTMKVPPLTILRPVCGLDAGLEETLETTYLARDAEYEVIFCIADENDPALPLIRKIILSHPETPSRLLTGDDHVSPNPKLNNLVKGWKAARHEWVAMIDSNVLLPPEYIQEMFSAWKKDTGLVTSPPLGIRPEGLWAKLECAVLNGYQARWQMAADQFSNGFAQGKVLFWRRDILDDAGGPPTLGHDLAEDVASTKIVRRSGRRVSMVTTPFPQPIFRRRFSEVWQRQVRWARVRRDGFPALFALEIFSGGFLPLLATIVLVVLDDTPAVSMTAAFVIWYAIEWFTARRAGWETSVAAVPVWILRDMLIPAIWLAAFGSRSFVWRGTKVGPENRTLAAAE